MHHFRPRLPVVTFNTQRLVVRGIPEYCVVASVRPYVVNDFRQNNLPFILTFPAQWIRL